MLSRESDSYIVYSIWDIVKKEEKGRVKNPGARSQNKI